MWPHVVFLITFTRNKKSSRIRPARCYFTEGKKNWTFVETGAPYVIVPNSSERNTTVKTLLTFQCSHSQLSPKHSSPKHELKNGFMRVPFFNQSEPWHFVVNAFLGNGKDVTWQRFWTRVWRASRRTGLTSEPREKHNRWWQSASDPLLTYRVLHINSMKCVSKRNEEQGGPSGLPPVFIRVCVCQDRKRSVTVWLEDVQESRSDPLPKAWTSLSWFSKAAYRFLVIFTFWMGRGFIM